MKITWLLAAALVVAITLIPTIVDGQRRFRWGQDSEVESLVAKLNTFPRQLGDWEAVADEELGPDSTSQLQPLAAINRVYVNSAENRRAHLFILLGPTGPASAHTPDICFSVRDYRPIDARRKVSIDPSGISQSKSFMRDFQSRDVIPHYLRSWYGWTVDGVWDAMAKPRFHFANKRYLVKVQIVGTFSNQADLEEDEITQEFVRRVERELRDSVFSSN